MVTLPWLMVSIWATGLSLFSEGVFAKPNYNFGPSPPYRIVEPCPERCSVSGSRAGNWSVYQNFRQFKFCPETLFYDFSLYDNVDNQAETHRIHACSSFGPDFSTLAPESSSFRVATVEPTNVTFEVGWWEEDFGLAASALRSVIRQMRKYVDHGHGATDRPFIMFGQSGQATVGLYIGESLLNQGMVSALNIFEANLASLNVSVSSLAMQLCGPEYDSTHIFGLMVTSNATFTPIQDAIKAWTKATCLTFSESVQFTGQATFTMPPLPVNGTLNGTMPHSATSLEAQKRHSRHVAHHARHNTLYTRGECKTVQVESGDSCGALAAKCGISPTAFAKYNPESDFCASLMPKQHACCSSGSLPDFSPKPNKDGSCQAYQVKTNDNCDNLAAEYSLTKQDIEDFNKKTWGWNGCKLLFIDTIMCLSKGDPPFPAPITNAVCGPQKPGSKPPTDGTDIADLNPCPLNACCNIWGQCGITKDFCVDTNTGAPGTAKSGTYGCISNCGTDVVKGNGNGEMKIAYYEGYGMNRECLFQDASQIDTSQYTHVHFAFGTLTPDYEVEVGDELSTYNFGQFKRIKGAKRILSFGGWAFSTEPATYAIFRDGVTSANRLKMATNIALFIEKHNLDGIDIDWEYPGAPDIPGIPAASKADGPNYLAFLAVLKNLLSPSKTLSIAAPSSYWYLKQYPIETIGRVVDYIVFMTYDLHGQWDANNAHSQEGCDTGNCLRSQVNLTETKQSLAMITKAGVPGEKVIVGITSYGRSYNMADAGCWGPDCLYTGGSMNSDAAKGTCTNAASYIADAELIDIMQGSKRAGRVVKQFVDTSSNSDVLIYDDTQWVSYMSSKTKKQRAKLYSAWGMGGTTDWASDLQTFHDPPKPAKSWAAFKQLASSGQNPKVDQESNGNWTDLDCKADEMVWPSRYSPSWRWKALRADEAWNAVIANWTKEDGCGSDFSHCVSLTFHITSMKCGTISGSNCVSTGLDSCSNSANEELSGPGAALILESMVQINNMFQQYSEALKDAGNSIDMGFDHIMDMFAPERPSEDNTWILNLLTNVLTFGTVTAAGPFFNNVLKNLPFFLTKPDALDDIKDTTMNIIGQGTTLAKDLGLGSSSDSDWTSMDQNKFKAFIGGVIDGWKNIAVRQLRLLFDGKEKTRKVLWNTMSNGKLIDGKVGEANQKDWTTVTDEGTIELKANIGKSIMGFIIPPLWRHSGTHAFIMNTGYACGERKAVEDYLSDDTMDATGACIDGKQYFLVHPDGDAKYGSGKNAKFSVPPGLDKLTPGNALFEGLTKENLIKGSVRTWENNGKKNSDAVADAFNTKTVSNLLDVDVTTPGYVRLPVCSPERAFLSWDNPSKTFTDDYPCGKPRGKVLCGEITYENQGSDASPKIEDCRQIIRNIEDDLSTKFNVLSTGNRQSELVHYKSCHLGVEATKYNHNVNFDVGGQVVIDIINEAIKKFGGDGRIGAKGQMVCTGNIRKQDVEWGIY